MTDTWVMEKVLIGLVACESERHTHDRKNGPYTWQMDGRGFGGHFGLTATQLL